MRKRTFFILFLLILPLNIHAQTQKLALIEVFQMLEENFPYSFSYANKNVQNIVATPPASLKVSFKTILTELEKETGLVFSILKNGIVAVSRPQLMQPQHLEEVVLTEYLAKGISKKTDASFEVNYQSFGILPGLIEPDVFQTLQALPGVESVNELPSEVNVRGGTSDQNLILWDGIRVYQTGHFFGLISAFNPYQTKQVALIKNGTNPAFGNSVSSVVSMQTDDEINPKLHTEVSSNLLSLQGFTDIPLRQNSSIQLSARTSINNWVETPTYNQYFDRAFQDSEIINNNGNIKSSGEEFKFHDINTRYLLQFKKDHLLRVNFFNIQNKVNFTENLSLDNPDSRSSELSQGSLGGGIFLESKWNSNFETSVQFYLSKYELYSENADIINNQKLIQENEILETGLKFNSIFKLNKLLSLQNGFEVTETGVSNLSNIDNPTFRRYIKKVILGSSFFSSVQYKSKNKRTNLVTGARLNHFNKFNIILLEPRFSFNQRFLKFFTFEILGEYKSQAATQIIDFQSDFLGVEKRRWQLANPDQIPLLKSKQLSTGINFSQNKWLITAEAYVKEVKGVYSQSQGFQNQYEHLGFSGSYIAKGLDFLVNKKFENFSSWISYSFSDNNYTFPVLENPSFPNNFEIAHSATLAGTYSYKKFSISTGLNYRTGKPFTRLISEGEANDFFNFEKANSSNLADYWRVDISAKQEFGLGKNTTAVIAASIWNVLDTENTIHSYYRERNGNIELVDQKALGFTPNLLFKIIF